MSLGPSENARRKFSWCWKRKFLIWRRAKYSTTYSPTNDLSRRKKRRNVLHEKWLRRVKRKKFEYWPDIPSKFFNILFFSEKSCYQCVLKMWAHLISLGSVWYWPCLLLFIKRPLILKRVQTKDKTFRCFFLSIFNPSLQSFYKWTIWEIWKKRQISFPSCTKN